MPFEYMFSFICSEHCKTIISLRKKCGTFSSTFKKNIPNNTTPTFQEVDGVTHPPNIMSMTQELHMVSRQPSPY